MNLLSFPASPCWRLNLLKCIQVLSSLHPIFRWQAASISMTGNSVRPSAVLSCCISLTLTYSTWKAPETSRRLFWAQLDNSCKHNNHGVKDYCRRVSERRWCLGSAGYGLTEGIHILFLSLTAGFSVYIMKNVTTDRVVSWGEGGGGCWLFGGFVLSVHPFSSAYPELSLWS